MARMARLVRAMPELVILIKGMAAAARSVFFTLALLIVLLYVFAIAFTQLLSKEPVGELHFSSVLKSMHTLWLYGALCDEITHLMSDLERAGIGPVLLLDAFILASALTVMNMLVGVLCEVVSAVATAEKEEQALGLVRRKMQEVFHELGMDSVLQGEAMITPQHFTEIVKNQEAARAMRNLGVDVLQMVDMADTFFADTDECGRYKEELTFGEFLDAVVQLRGTNYATVKDLVNLKNYISKQLASSQERTIVEVDKQMGAKMRRQSDTIGRALERSWTHSEVGEGGGETRGGSKTSITTLNLENEEKEEKSRSLPNLSFFPDTPGSIGALPPDPDDNDLTKRLATK